MTILLSFKHSMTFNNNYWMRCSIAILFFCTIIQKRMLFVQSFPTGAGGCAAGTASVTGSPHSTALGGLSVAGVTVSIGSQVIPGSATLTLQPGTYSITFSGPFLGILIRLAPVDGVADTTNALTVSDTTNYRIYDACIIPTTGITHNNKDQKTTATFGLDTTRLADKIVTMDVTMVTALSSYNFDTYTLNNTQAVVPTTPAPIVAPVTPAPVIAPVTPAPLAVPITPAPLAVPVTPAPVVPVTPAPVVPGVPTRAPSVRAPVAASVRIPVQSESRTNARQPHRNPTTNNRSNNNNNNNNNDNYRDTNIAAAALVSDQTYTLDTPTTAPIETTTISQKGLMQYLKNFW